MKTSKIKRIEDTKEWTNDYGTTIYHSLEMENGDKINIGKKKMLQVGWEIDYEIVEFGQQEYQKAKAVKREFVAQKKDDSYIRGIEVGHAVNNAVNMLCAGLEFDNIPNDLKMGQKIEAYANNIMLIANKLKSE